MSALSRDTMWKLLINFDSVFWAFLMAERARLFNMVYSLSAWLNIINHETLLFGSSSFLQMCTSDAFRIHKCDWVQRFDVISSCAWTKTTTTTLLSLFLLFCLSRFLHICIKKSQQKFFAHLQNSMFSIFLLSLMSYINRKYNKIKYHGQFRSSILRSPRNYSSKKMASWSIFISP